MQRERTVLTAASLLLLASACTGGTTIHYGAEVTPDHPSLSDVFSTESQSGTTWSAVGGELTLTTTSHRGIWFGNHNPDFDNVPWDLAGNAEGNFVSVRARLLPDGWDWNYYMTDGSHNAYVVWRQGQIECATWAGPRFYGVDTSQYHDYSTLLAEGWVVYRVDGDVVYSGPSGAGGPAPS